MNTMRETHGTTLTPRRPAKRVVLAGRFALAAKVADHFRALGWEVHALAADRDVHAATAEAEPHALLIQEDAGDESGYLACAKLRHTRPALKLVVVGAERTTRGERFAAFVGAGFVAEADGLNGLVAAVSC